MKTIKNTNISPAQMRSIKSKCFEGLFGGGGSALNFKPKDNLIYELYTCISPGIESTLILVMG